MTYANTNTSGGIPLSWTSTYDYASGTYNGNPAIVWTNSYTLVGKTSSSVNYLNPTTGAVVANGSNTDTTITTYDPVDYESQLRNAVTTVGQSTTVKVKARISGSGITTAFSAIGGGTALNMDYSYTVTRQPNETITVGSTSYTTCKLQINATVSNVTLEGGNSSNPYYNMMFNTLASIYTAPISSTVWTSNQVPNIVKSTGSFTAAGSTASSSQTLTTVKLAAR